MASVQNLGDGARGIDLRIAPKNMYWPFEPNGMPALLLTTGASAASLLPRTARGGDDCVRVYNAGTTAVRLRFGPDNTVTATPTDVAVAPGAIEVLRVGTAQYVATYSAGAGAVELTCGVGM